MAQPEDLALKRDIESRLELLNERLFFFSHFPLLPPNNNNNNTINDRQLLRLELVQGSNVLMEACRFARANVICAELGVSELVECDDFDFHCTHLVAMLGDDIIGGVRMSLQHYDNAPCALVDRVFIAPRYRNNGLARRLMGSAVEASGSMRFFVAIPTHYSANLIHSFHAKLSSDSRFHSISASSFTYLAENTPVFECIRT